jgi:hypothetical protein
MPPKGWRKNPEEPGEQVKEAAPAFNPLASLVAPEIEVEDGVTFISEVVPGDEEPASPPPPLPAVAAVDGLVPETCQFCGARNLIDIRRSYYCPICRGETSK